MGKRYFTLILLSLCVLLSPLMFVSGSETKTVELFPLADSYADLDSPSSNYGKELYLYSDYEDQRIVVDATTFEVPLGSHYIKVTLPINGKIIGSFIVTEGGNRDIYFKITDADPTAPPFPYPTTYYETESRVTSLEFSFVAPFSGDFYLGFDNSFSWFTRKTVSLSDVILTMEPFGAICSPIFLLFDLSSIPPEATINSAILSMVFESSAGTSSNTVDAFYCSRSNWDEQSITYENAPLSEDYLSLSSSLEVAGLSIGNYCQWDVKPDVVRSRPTTKLVEVIVIVDSELSTGAIRFFSRESENKPSLLISYTYVSVSSSVAPTTLIQGQKVAMDVETDPAQDGGSITIQYSTDQIEWLDIKTVSFGNVFYSWTPKVTGQVYVRSLWETSWEGGSYSTLSSVSGLFIIPLYLLILIPAVILGTIIGIYFWRKRKAN